MSETTPGGATRMTPDRTGASGEAAASPAQREIIAYVRLVRAGLADLAPEDVEELTAGMEADLAEMVADRGGSVRDQLGAPQVYAAELRRAAGLPPAAPVPGRRGLDEVYRVWQDSVTRRRREHPAFDGVADFLLSLRPSWWVIRGVTLATVLVAFPVLLLGGGLGAVVLLGLPVAAVAVVLSVRLGRRSLGTGGSPLRTLGDLALGALTLAICVAAAFTFLGVTGPGVLESGPPPTPDYEPGLIEGPANLYVYDADGRRVEAARLFDADGNPVRLTSGVGVDSTAIPRDVYGVPQTNVYPGPGDGRPDPWVGLPDLPGAWTPPASIAPLQPAPDATTPPATTPPATPGPAASSPTTGSQPSSVTPPASTTSPTPRATTATR